MKKITAIKTEDEARQIAIDWQNKQSNRSISYMELYHCQKYFEALAEKFGLQEEFEENGII